MKIALSQFYKTEDYVQKDLIAMPTSENLKLAGGILKTPKYLTTSYPFIAVMEQDGNYLVFVQKHQDGILFN